MNSAGIDIQIGSTTVGAYPAILIACLVMLVVLPSSLPAEELDGIPEHVVKVALNPKSIVIYSGVMRKQLTPMGDAAAVAITKVLAGERPQADVVDRILMVIAISFESPEAIVDEADKKPKTALFVLASLNDPPLRAEQRKRWMQLRKKLETLAQAMGAQASTMVQMGLEVAN